VNRNAELEAQKGYNTLADCMLSQIRWHKPGAEVNPLAGLNIARWYIHWWNGRQMNRYIGKELDRRYNEYKADSSNTRSKAVIDLVLQAYIPESAARKPEKLDPEFRAFAIRQIRLFLFAGHDSTSITICYSLHLLSKNPDCLARLRAEHDEVFGRDISAAPFMLKGHPYLANSLPYTTAVIKEALRLFAPAGTSRAGKQNESIVDDQGNVCPTDHAMVWIIHVEMHRAPKYWKRPDEFLPERWLVEPGHELYPMKGAWRPFEHGPRNCIAQSLVMTELRVILACIVRQFDFKPAYDEWDRLHPRKGLKTYRGERVYQVEEGAAHPVEHYPCRVSLIKR
jgi:cytochrome P450